MVTYVETFHLYPRSETFDQAFRWPGFADNTSGILFLLHSSFCLRQLVLKSETVGIYKVNVLFSSGMEYNLITTDSVSEYVLNTASRYTFWQPLPAGTRLGIQRTTNYDSAFEVAWTFRPAPERNPWI